MTLYVAELDTGKWRFSTADITEGKARANLRRAWNQWRKSSGATYTWADLEDGVIVWEARPGVVNQF